jgi:NAD(P)-dependent dehydrogenase (short-subunit alcohol dehydrogenase family)
VGSSEVGYDGDGPTFSGCRLKVVDVRLQGKVAVVTGASRGIGRATVLEMVRAGAEGVVLTSRKSENLEAAVGELIEAGVASDRIEAMVGRADSIDDAQRVIASTIDRFGACDILVNNAGTNPAAGSLMEVDLGALDKTWAVNQRAPLLWTRQAWQQWMSEHGGAIVNVASIGGLRPSAIMGAYNISKAALIHMTYQLAHELAPGVRVNAVAPGVVRTRLSGALWEGNEDVAASFHPLGRLGEPADVASSIVFLCSEAASWLTGVVLPVDGGVVGATGTASLLGTAWA